MKDEIKIILIIILITFTLFLTSNSNEKVSNTQANFVKPNSYDYSITEMGNFTWYNSSTFQMEFTNFSLTLSLNVLSTDIYPIYLYNKSYYNILNDTNYKLEYLVTGQILYSNFTDNTIFTNFSIIPIGDFFPFQMNLSNIINPSFSFSNQSAEFNYLNLLGDNYSLWDASFVINNSNIQATMFNDFNITANLMNNLARQTIIHAPTFTNQTSTIITTTTKTISISTTQTNPITTTKTVTKTASFDNFYYIIIAFPGLIFLRKLKRKR